MLEKDETAAQFGPHIQHHSTMYDSSNTARLSYSLQFQKVRYFANAPFENKELHFVLTELVHQSNYVI
jgi:hypothetical protein